MPRTLDPRILIAIALVSPTPSWAQTAAPPANHSYDFVLGRWNCNGLSTTGKVEYQFKQEVDKFGEWFRERNPERTHIAFMKFDAKTRLWRYFDFDSSGTYEVWSAPDFVNDRQTWTGSSTDSNGEVKPRPRIVFSKVSDREKREDFCEPGKNGSCRFIGMEVCTKQQ